MEDIKYNYKTIYCSYQKLYNTYFYMACINYGLPGEGFPLWDLELGMALIKFMFLYFSGKFFFVIGVLGGCNAQS